jgi:hypothetical protein
MTRTFNITRSGITRKFTVQTGVGATGATGAPGTTDYNELDNVPTEFPPSAHDHVVSDITPVSSQHLIGRHANGTGNAQEVTVSGGLEFSGSGIQIANTAVTAAEYTAPTITVDSKGRITAAASVTYETPAGAAAQIAALGLRTVTPIVAGADIQAALNAAAAGDHLVLMPGTHTPTFVETTQWDGETCWVGLQIDKPITLELAEGAILTNPNGINGIRQTPEIVFDQGRWKTVATLESASGIEARADGAITATGSVIVTVATLSGSTPATYTRSDTGATSYPVVLDQWDSLGNNVSFRFTTANSSNNAVGDSFYVSRTAEPIYHIRIGTGTHTTAIDGVVITGQGKLLINSTGQQSTLSEVADISSGILSHGRVSNLTVENIIIEGTLERSILIQGEHTGEDYIDNLCPTRLTANSNVHAEGIYFGAGTEYSADGITIRNIRTIDSRAVLLGHPAHRGEVARVSVTGNDFRTTSGPGLECNFRLRNFTVSHNRLLSSVVGVSLRRGPAFGSVFGNVAHGGGGSIVESNATTFPSPRNVTTHGNSSSTITTGVVDFALGLSGNTLNQIGAVWSQVYVGDRFGTNTQCVFTHSDLSATANSYALMQTATGGTFLNAASGQSINFRVNNSAVMALDSTTLTFSASKNIAFNTATGTKIGTATTQKIGFWNATPVVQPEAVADATDAATAISQLNSLLAKLRTIGLIAP